MRAFSSSWRRLQLGRRLDERRPLLGRVADARTLGGELRRDQEAEAEQGRAERDLPARDRADASDHDGGPPAGRRERVHTSSTMPPPTRRATSSSPTGGGDTVVRGAVGFTVFGTADAPGRVGALLPGAGEAALQSAGTGPAGGGCGPYFTGRLRTEVRQPRLVEGGDVHADRGLERLVVGAPVGVRADQRHERVLAVRPDQVVDGARRSRRTRG